MKKIIAFFIMVFFIAFSGITGNEASLYGNENVRKIYKKMIKGKVIYTRLGGGYPPENLGYIQLKMPNVLTIYLLDVSIADASSKHIKTVIYKNVKSLPFEYSIPVEGIGFIPGYTYALSILLDVNMNNEYTSGNFHNSLRLSVPIDRTQGDVVVKDAYIVRIR